MRVDEHAGFMGDRFDPQLRYAALVIQGGVRVREGERVIKWIG